MTWHYPIPENESERVQATRSFEVVGGESAPAFDSLVSLVAELLNVPIAIASVIEEDRQLFLSRYGINGWEAAREVSFCAHTVALGSFMTVPDTREDPRFADNPFVVGEPYIRAYAGAPLVTREGHAVGSLCAVALTPREFNDRDRRILTGLAQCVLTNLELRRTTITNRRLANMHAQRESYLESIYDGAFDGILEAAPNGQITRANNMASSLLGLSRDEICGQHLWNLAPPATRDELRSRFVKYVQRSSGPRGESKLFDTRLTGPGARLIDVEVALVDANLAGERRLTLFFRDVTEKRRKIRESQKRLNLYSLANSSSGTGQFVVNADADHVECDERSTHLLGVETTKWSALCQASGTTGQKALDEALRRVSTTKDESVHLQLTVCRAGEYVRGLHVTLAHLSGQTCAGFVRDTTLTHFEDSQSGLPNRAALETAIDAVDHSAGNALALALVHCAGIREIDQVHPWSADRIILMIGERLAELARTERIPPPLGAHRLKGGTFALFFDTEDHDPAALAESAFQELSKPFSILGETFHLRPRIGVASFEAGTASGDILRRANAALSDARGSDHQYIVFHTRQADAIAEHLRLEHQLREALANEEIEGYLQPLVKVDSGELFGFEALARWELPDGTRVSPARFVPVAEQAGLVSDLGWLMIKKAIRFLGKYHTPARPLSIAVNIAAQQLFEPTLAENLVEACAEFGVPPSALHLEITERTVIRDLPTVCTILEGLRARGLQVYLDDFGTGYSSLSYLRQLPLAGIKIDRTFVDQLGESSKDTRLVLNLLRLAADFELDVIAEGVETEQQRMFLRALGCDRAQGYFFHRPMTKTDAAALLSQGGNHP